MGNWNINISGLGSHHNNFAENDADRMAREFVEELRRKGHWVREASFTFGGAEDLSAPKAGVGA